jgi:hypothetical protein
MDNHQVLAKADFTHFILPVDITYAVRLHVLESLQTLDLLLDDRHIDLCRKFLVHFASPFDLCHLAELDHVEFQVAFRNLRHFFHKEQECIA